MVDAFLGIDEPATIDKRIDAESLVVGINTVFRERVQVTGATALDIAVVTAANGLEVDVTRVIPGVGATNLGKAEDAVHADGDTGVLALAVRNDAVSALAADGDYIPLIVNATGRLLVQTQGGAGGGTASVDDSVFTVAVDSGTPAMGFFGDAAPDSVDDGDVGVVRMSANRNLYSTIRDAAGNERGANVTAANALEVDGSAVTQPISAAALPLPAGASTSALQLADGHNVTVDNAAGAAAVNIQDGGNVITIDNDDTVSANNSSVAVLGIGANFTGPGDDLLGYTSVSVQIDSSHDSAVDGMIFEFSVDNVNWDDMYLFTYTAADGARRFQFPVTARYFRVNYTNGATGQTHFRLQTILHRQTILTTIHRLADAIDPDRSSTLVKAAIVAQANGSGDFATVDATAGGNLKVAIEEADVSATGLAKAEDAVHGDGDTGVMALAVRNDAITALAADGDYIPLIVNGSGRLLVQTEGGGGGTSAVDDAPFTLATDSGTPAMGFFGDAAPDSVEDGDAGVLRMSANRNLYSTIRDAAGNERGANVSAGNALLVDASATTQPISAAALPLPAGAATSALQLADGHNVTVDNGAAGAAVNVQDGGNSLTVDALNDGSLNVQIGDGVDTALVSGAGALIVDGSAVTQPISAAALPLPAGAATSALQLADGHDVTVDNVLANPVQVEIGDGVETALVTAAGELNVIATAQPGVDIGDVTITNATLSVVGDVAHDDPDAGANPVKVGGRAVTTLPTAVAANDRVDAIYTTQGAATVAGVDGTTPLVIAVNASGQLEIDVSAQQGSALEIVGDVAADAPGNAVNPVILAGIAQEIDDSAPPERVSAEGDAAYLTMSRDGAIFVAGGGPQQWFSSNLYTGTQTDDSLHAAPGVGLQLMITDIYFAAEAAVDFTLEADDVADVFLYGYFASGEGDGVAQTFKTPIPVGDNRALLFTSSAAVNHIVVVSGFIQPV